MGKCKIATETERKAIIDFYLRPNTMATTASFFKIDSRRIKNILLASNIPLHDKQVFNKLGIEERRRNCLEKYGVDNVMKVADIVERGKQTCLEKYGHENFGQSSVALEKKKQTNLDRFGTEWHWQNNEIINKTKQTKLERYNDAGYTNIEKAKQTCLEKYGVENYAQTDEFKNKKIADCQARFGVNYYMQTDEWKEKNKQTCLERYGVDSYTKTSECKEKIKHTCLEKYGVENTLSSDRIKAKARATCLEKYGTEYYTQSESACTHRRAQFCYNDNNFDSFPELCFYLFCVTNGLKIYRQSKKLMYTYNDKVHYYFPDFELDGNQIEIKGPQFINENGCWQNPFDHNLDGLFEAKHQCAINNNVKILYEKDYKKYVDWFYTNGFKKEDFLAINSTAV